MNAALQPAPGACGGNWRTQPYRETLLLRDGRAVALRPARRSDAAALQDFFATLSPRSRLLRFHGMVSRVPDGVLRELTTQVPQRHVALLALADDERGLPGIAAEARYVVDADAAASAEFALAVADGYQGLGLGRALLQRLALHADSLGLRQLHGGVMAGNEPMLQLLHSLGATLRTSGSEVRATLDL